MLFLNGVNGRNAARIVVVEKHQDPEVLLSNQNLMARNALMKYKLSAATLKLVNRCAKCRSGRHGVPAQNHVEPVSLRGHDHVLMAMVSTMNLVVKRNKSSTVTRMIALWNVR